MGCYALPFPACSCGSDRGLQLQRRGTDRVESITLTLASSITVPNLGNVPGFFGPAPSGTSVTWVADVFGGAMPGFPIQPTLTASPKVFLPSVSANSLITFVENSGNYIQP